ncbi:hypothetical protein M8C21_018822 [Ambrosia artemisiifolia]|uniref:Uncharacterized protein n=1 Tax=Ambrosia artemisiifolia TaxID=4212 RepID=A0AAD5GL54_AMBAR|nr:hypothetical protein M8C21_018822 [Ambrosia artemisiifolia]
MYGIQVIVILTEIELKTAPADYRFPTTNQSRHCFTRYVEFHRNLIIYGITVKCQLIICFQTVVRLGSLGNGSKRVGLDVLRQRVMMLLYARNLPNSIALFARVNGLTSGTSRGRMGYFQALCDLAMAWIRIV